MSMSRKNDKDHINLSKVTTYQTGIAQSAVHRSLQKASEEALRPYAISKMHWMIIGTASESNKGVRITDLANTIGTNLSYMTNTVNLLEEKQILTRVSSKKDSRAKLITVHPKFLPKCKDIEAELRAALRKEVYSKVSPEEFAQYVKVIFKLSS